MDKILAPIKQRIIKYVDFKGFEKIKFFENLGISASNFRGTGLKSEAGGDVIAKILSQDTQLNPDWLLMGKGDMLKGSVTYSESISMVSEPVVAFNQKKGIPLVNVTAIGGFGNSSFTINELDVKDFYVIPKFQHKKIDFMIEVEGSSMYPKYNSGDVVACRIINEKSFIQWNKTHVVATRGQGIIIKRLKKHTDDSLLMISDNNSYDPFVVPYEEIDGVALVVGVIRLE